MNCTVGNRSFKNLHEAKQYCLENDFDPMTMIEFDDPGFRIITPEQRHNITEIVNYINAIIKIDQAEYLNDYGIKYNKPTSIDYNHYINYPKNDSYLMSWHKLSYDELLSLKECYKNIVDIPIYQ